MEKTNMSVIIGPDDVYSIVPRDDGYDVMQNGHVHSHHTTRLSARETLKLLEEDREITRTYLTGTSQSNRTRQELLELEREICRLSPVSRLGLYGDSRERP